MRNIGNKTPTSKQEQKNEVNAEKTSGKKLVQARLPFKILPPGSSPASVATDGDISTDIVSESAQTSDGVECISKQDARKRKLSYEQEDEKHEDKTLTRSLSSDSKENLSAATTKKKKTTSRVTAESIDNEVILLDDSDPEEPVKENILDSKVRDSPKTPMNAGNKRKGAGTPGANTTMGDISKTTGGGSASKVQIKLPLSGKKKRRKSQRKSITEIETNAEVDTKADSSDDIEMIADELNPQKRQKVDGIVPEQQNEDICSTNKCDTTKQLNATDLPVTKSKDNKNKSNLQNPQRRQSSRISLPVNEKSMQERKKSEETKPAEKKSPHILDMFASSNGLIKSKLESNKKPTHSSKTDEQAIEADDDEDARDSESSNTLEQLNNSGDKVSKGDLKVTDSPASSSASKFNNSSGSIVHKKGLTPKQQRLMEQRRKAREEKERRLQEQKDERERKLQEEKMQKQREKEEKELAKKREREEKEEQKRKEREEKEEVKRKEREEKEMKRLAEIEAKNEERRKRNEVKEEELRKKEEERKRKELEREEAENKKKKAAEAFTKFFKPTRSSIAGEDDSLCLSKETVGEGVCDIESLAFRPFQIKGDMKLAPLCRKVFTDAAREKLDSFLCGASSTTNSGKQKIDLYLTELQSGKIKPEKWRRLTVDTKEDDDDVVIVENELERAAQAIVEEKIRPVERYRAKFYKFHENRRPPYFGTWRKKTKVITPRRPLAQDKEYFDYEVDSDLEWEEEEPGESLDGSDEEEKEKESEDEDYEVDNEWFVPHGHLSDEEMQNEDEYGLGDDNTREAQKAKLKILQQEFAQEMKKKTEKIKPRLVGCIWADYNGNQPELCPNIIWDSLNLRAMTYTTPPLINEPVAEISSETNEPSSPSTNASGAVAEKLKRIVLTETMLKDLIRLIHGNRHSKVFLINEFIAYVEQSEDSIKNGDVRGPLKSVVREKIEEFALWQVIEVNNNLNSKKVKKKLCWLVSEEILKKYDMESLGMHNKWKYTLQPKFVESAKRSANNSIIIEEDSTEGAMGQSESETPTSTKKKAKHKSDGITKFTKVLTAEEKVQQLQQKSESPKTVTSKTRTPSRIVTPPDSTATTPKSGSSVPTVKKRVPLLMSVARGQQIPTPTKNALISQFLKKNKKDDNQQNKRSTTPMDVDEVIVLD